MFFLGNEVDKNFLHRWQEQFDVFYSNLVLKAAHEVIDSAFASNLKHAFKKTFCRFVLRKQSEVGPEGVGKTEHVAFEAHEYLTFCMSLAQIEDAVLGK